MRLGRERSGQLAVEFALLIPVMVAVALVALNLLRFADACARFDRVALDAVVTQGVSPAGEASVVSSVQAVREALEQAVEGDSCEVEVRGVDGSGSGGSATFDLAAGTVRLVCELSYRPWPSRVEIAGVTWSAPVVLKHERALVVDRYRAGVVA